MLLLSPHLDDAALSCAGRILRGEVARVITIFAGIPRMEMQLTDWDRLTRADDASARIAERREEDRRAWTMLGQDFVQWDFTEGEADRIDTAILDEAIRNAAVGHNAVLIPAGIGRHPHHLLVRNSALRALAGDVRIVLYGELPYASFYGWPDANQRHVDVEAYWRAELADLPELAAGPAQIEVLDFALVKRKQALISQYASQIGAVAGGNLDFVHRTIMFDREVCFEVFPAA